MYDGSGYTGNDCNGKNIMRLDGKNIMRSWDIMGKTLWDHETWEECHEIMRHGKNVMGS